MRLMVREFTQADADMVINFFRSLSPEEAALFGLANTTLAYMEEWYQNLSKTLYLPLHKANYYFLIWEVNDKPFGFSFVDRIVYGEEGYMHCYILDPKQRSAGRGKAMVEHSAKVFFDQFKFDELFAEPYVLNTPANRVLQSNGFKLLHAHNNTSPEMAYNTPVNQWVKTP